MRFCATRSPASASKLTSAAGDHWRNKTDARLLSLLLETIRSDFNRAAVMELACHLGPRSHWDALSVQLGIVGGQQQWLRATRSRRIRSDE